MKPIAAIALALLLTTGLSACGKKDESVKDVGALTAAEAKDIAKDGFIFGLPLVYFAQQQGILTNVPRPEGTRAPYNQFAHYRDFPDPSNRTVVGWNVDTLYSIGTLDLTDEPIVLSVPPMGKRWWLMQIIDQWDDVPAAPGTRTFGNDGGNYALVGPNFKGTLPPGVTEVKVDTSLAGVAGRTYVAGKADVPAVQKIQDQYRLTPLSQWGADYKAPESVPVKPGVDMKTPLGDQVFALSADEFFGRVNASLVDNPARPADAPILERLAKIGVKPGGTFSADAFGPDVRAAIDEGMEAGKQAIRDHESKMGKVVNSWTINLNLGRYGTDYLTRAAQTFFFIGANLPEDAVYPQTVMDKDGNALMGEHKYVLRFPKGQLPPAKNFWSITMYDKDGYLVVNPIKRQAVGDRSNLKADPDGSVPIYIQSTSPGKAKVNNWLPSPPGQFKVNMRLYTPEQVVMDGKWAPPAIEKVQ